MKKALVTTVQLVRKKSMIRLGNEGKENHAPDVRKKENLVAGGNLILRISTLS